MNEYSKILKVLLDTYKSGGIEAVTAYVDKIAQSDQTKKEIQETNKILDIMTKKRASLDEAKDDGFSTKEWMDKEIEDLKNK